MTTSISQEATEQRGCAPVVEDLSTYVICGRVVSFAPTDPRTGRSPAQGIEDCVLAERLGFHRVFMPERFDMKEAGALMGGIGARTARIGIGVGAIVVPSRHPRLMAALGHTLHACYGPRFTLGLGRTAPEISGFGTTSYQGFEDYASLLRRLWRGETIDYDGPAGRYDGLRLADPYDGPPPKLYACVLGGPKGCAAAARSFDGVMLTPFLTPAGVAKSVSYIREECDRIGRDPAEVRICHPVVTAPGLDDYETRMLCHARAVTYFHAKGYFDMYARLNGWDAPGFADRLRHHRQLAAHHSADGTFHRSDLLGPAELIPDRWMADTCGLGSDAAVVATLRRFRDAGADEIVVYGSNPDQNAGVIARWRQTA